MMGGLWLAVLAVGPGMCLVHVVWARDKEREPLGNVFFYLLLGAASVLPAVLLEGVAQHVCPFGGAPLVLLPIQVFLGVALVEEGSKRLLLHLRARGDPHLEEPFDWLVYAVAVALGFATVENLLYVYQGCAGVAVLRAFTAVPGHALDGTMMGWRLARAARMQGAGARRERWLALLEPTAWHAAYDLPLFAAEQDQFTCLSLLFFGGVVCAQWRICVARVRKLAHEQHHGPPPLLAADELVRRLRRRRSHATPAPAEEDQPTG